MFYKDDKFWINAGSDYCWGLLNYLNVDCSFQEIKNILEERILNENSDLNIENSQIKSIIKGWLEVKRLVLLGKKQDELSKNWRLEIRHFKNLYIILEPTGHFWKMFEIEVGDEDSIEIADDMEQLRKDFYKLKNSKEVFEFVSRFYHKNYIKGTFGPITNVFFMFLVEIILIYKGYGPMIFLQESGHNMQQLLESHNDLYGEILSLPENKWKTSKSFQDVVDFWTKTSNDYLQYIKNDYT